MLEWVAISFSRDLPDPWIKPVSPALAGGFLHHRVTWETQLVLSLLKQVDLAKY